MESKKEWSRPDEKIIAFYVAQEAAVEKRSEGNNVVPLIKFFSFLCVFLGFALLVLRMEYQPSFAKNWFNEPVEQPLEMTPFDWEIETTKSTDFAREGGSEASEVLPLAVWGLWGPWSECSKRKYCQEGQQHRRRVCLSLEESAQCLGVSMEARDCPATACVHAYSSPPILVDESPAPTTSFLAMECNTTVKYAASGRFRDLVPNSVYQLYPSAKKMLESGFFALERIPKLIKHESPIIKVCFEPFGVWSLTAARKVFHLNRSTGASLKEVKSSLVVGLAIALRPDGTLYGAMLATGTPGGVYNNVYYRRFRGRSFQEDIPW